MLRRALLLTLAALWVVVPAAHAAPVAALSGPATAKVGQTVTFDAASSSGVVADYSWDLDGSGTFARSTGTRSKLSTSFDQPGPRTVTVRVTDEAGATSTAAVDIVIQAVDTPPAGTGGGDPGTTPQQPAVTPAGPIGGDPAAGIAPLSRAAQTWVQVGSRTRFAAINGAARRSLASVRRGGLWVNLLSDRPARFVLDVVVPRAAARRLKLRGPRAGTGVRIARARIVLRSAGQKAVRLAIPAGARRRLTRPVTLSVRGSATDLKGQRAAVSRTFALRR